MLQVRTDERLKVARAVARGNFAHLLSESNAAGAGVRLDKAVAGGQAYFVTPRPELLVLDVDLPADPTRSAEVLASFDLLIDCAQRAGVPHIAVDSGRAGHRHGYFVVGTGANRVRLERWCRTRGLDVRTAGVRPPGTPHRLSATTGWSPDIDTSAVLQALTSPVDGDATAHLANQVCPVALPGRIQVAVRHGHERAGYASPSHARMALAVAVRARGGGPGLVEAILRDQASPLGETFRMKAPGWQRSEMSRIWDKAGMWISASGASPAGEHLRRVCVAAHRGAWKGAAGGSDLAVLEELVRRAAAVPTIIVGASIPDVAVGAGVSADTARVALRRLSSNGWVKVISQETARTTRTYALVLPVDADITEGPDVAHVGIPGRDEFGDLGADIARHGALGKVTMRVARLLAARAGLSSRELADALSMAPPSVRHHLRKLTAAGIAARHGQSWQAASSPALVDDLAVALGVHGARRRQESLVAAVRAARAAARATFARLRTWTPPTARAASPPPA